MFGMLNSGHEHTQTQDARRRMPKRALRNQIQRDTGGICGSDEAAKQSYLLRIEIRRRPQEARSKAALR